MSDEKTWSSTLADAADKLLAERNEARHAAQVFLTAILERPGWKPNLEKVYRDMPWLKPPEP